MSSFFSKPGKEGAARKAAFLKLIEQFENHEYTPAEAFVALYNFYLAQKGRAIKASIQPNEDAFMLTSRLNRSNSSLSD